MIYRVIITTSYGELWYDFVDFGQASVFAEAAKLNNVPTLPDKYCHEEMKSVTITLMTAGEHKKQLEEYARITEEMEKQNEAGEADAGSI